MLERVQELLVEMGGRRRRLGRCPVCKHVVRADDEFVSRRGRYLHAECRRHQLASDSAPSRR